MRDQLMRQSEEKRKTRRRIVSSPLLRGMLLSGLLFSLSLLGCTLLLPTAPDLSQKSGLPNSGQNLSISTVTFQGETVSKRMGGIKSSKGGYQAQIAGETTDSLGIPVLFDTSFF